MIMIALTEDNLVRLSAIQMDHDAQDALDFIQERILPEIPTAAGLPHERPARWRNGTHAVNVSY
jgi:hypothetical protein